MTLPFLVGVGLTIGFLSVSWLTGLVRDRGVYPVSLIAIAMFYIVFAFENGGLSEIVFNSIVAALFLVLAVFGYVRSLTLVAIGLVLHGVFDVVYAFNETNPSPEWWAPFCFGVDLLLGMFLVFAIRKSVINNRS